MDWRQIDMFRGIDLNDSFVMSWKLVDDELQIELETSIWPESEWYLDPEPNEYTCYRRLTLVISGCKQITGLSDIESVEGCVDPDGSTDYGNIDELSKIPGGFHLAGNFGSVEVFGSHAYWRVHT